MQCFIYKSLRKDELYLYLNKRDDFSILPEALLQNLGKLVFVMELQLDLQRKLAREDVSKVMSSLASKGFFVQMPPVLMPLSFPEKARQLH
ncbi:YcgL domain-containing protein [Methylomonas paludis]|uniref:YcgL domain-containing protein KEF85_00235 n=1 Tax=Methylomonas paludis TaxID=1173101 RepID=A0A975RA85_9GAMM|nr:YcgL domain-containing protein [Methylomonas paludis]QWF70971.1 YcgL domain-containing protein [Methylomonas paludis]